MDRDLVAERINRCRQAIRDVYGRPEDEVGATLFVEHHLEELSETYWIAEFGSAAPSPESIINGLDATHRSDESGYSVDFRLPGSVTQYMICVEASDGGALSVSMES
ncbi:MULTISPECIES: DUF2004 domain-containing protein [Microbacterium]|uniref:DUF2004 domain-containing protein n=1 Tax=Microbacterium oxydans TaxID=82380 RepID=A0A3S9WFQ3_9MICO|nr:MULTISPECIES: DUF2004 domain-containing protein [Microbacterium]AZS38902.1 hypothetical protein CVS54_00199 [Microbacterium oxydans]